MKGFNELFVTIFYIHIIDLWSSANNFVKILLSLPLLCYLIIDKGIAYDIFLLMLGEAH